MSSSRIRFLALFLLVLPVLSEAQTKGIVTFGGLKNLEFINQYYDDGKGSLGSGPGPNFGLQFTANAQTIISASKGGSGNFINNPGGYPVMFFQTGQNITTTPTNGIQTALWFYYSALQSGAVTVYAGPNGTGNIPRQHHADSEQLRLYYLQALCLVSGRRAAERDRRID